MTKISRRSWLKGAAGAAVTLPFLRHSSVSAQQTPPKRLVIMYSSNGVIHNDYWPSMRDGALALPYILEPLNDLRDKMLVVRNVDAKSAMNPRLGRNSHDIGLAHALTANYIEAQNGRPAYAEFGHLTNASPGATTVDQYIASKLSDETRFRSLVLGSGLRTYSTRPLLSYLSYSRPFQPVVPMGSPQATFDRVFSDYVPDAKVDTIGRRRMMVLDFLRRQADGLKSTSPMADREKIDKHIQSLDELALQVKPQEGMVASCEPGAKPTSGDRTDQVTRGQLDLVAQALKCDMTRVVTFQCGTAQSGIRYSWLGITDGHHGMSHDTGRSGDLRRINRWYAEQVAYLAGQLDGIVESDGSTLLDNTMIVWLNEVSTGHNHRYNNMPLTILGSGGGYLKSNQVINANGRSMGEFFTTIIEGMGITDSSFGAREYNDGRIDSILR